MRARLVGFALLVAACGGSVTTPSPSPEAVASPATTSAPSPTPTPSPTATPRPTPEPHSFSVTGTVFWSDGNPVSGAWLTANDVTRLWGETNVQTAANGMFSINLGGSVGKGGRYCFRVDAPGAPALYFTASGWSHFPDEDPAIDWCSTEVGPFGGPPIVFDVKLPKFATVSGTVVDKNGQPFPGVQVGQDRGALIIGHTITDATGRFTLLSLPGTTYIGFYVGNTRQERLGLTVRSKNITNLKVTLPVAR